MEYRKDCKIRGWCMALNEYLLRNGLYNRINNCDKCELFESIYDKPKKPELKPCPFCGGEAEIKRDTGCMGHGDYGPEKWVQCKSCGVRTHKYLCDGYYGCEMTDEELSEKWNKRV